MAKPSLVIKDNNTGCQEPCALCGRWDEATIGPAIFVEGTWNFVCNGCAKDYAPELYEVVSLWERQRTAKNLYPKVLDEAIRQELISDASEKIVRGVRQFDYFNEDTGAIIDCDNDKDYDLFSSVCLELRRSDCVRLQIPEGYTREDVLKGLGLILDWIKRDDGLITNIAADVEKEKERYAYRLGASTPTHERSPFENEPPQSSHCPSCGKPNKRWWDDEMGAYICGNCGAGITAESQRDSLDLDVWGEAF